MEAQELLDLARRGEDSRTQFKRSQDTTNAQSLAAELVAFSNAKGGRILIGIADDGSVVGLLPAEVRRINQLLSNAASESVRPPISIDTENVEVGDKLVMVATVREGSSKPYADNGGTFWFKNGADKRRVTSREELQRMFQSAGLIHADEVPVAGTTVADLDQHHFREYYEKQYGESLNDVEEPLDQLLENLVLARDGALNLAGLLLFARDPQRYRPELVVKAVSFAGTDVAGEVYRDSQDIGGCLKEMHAATMAFLLRNLHRVQGDRGFNSLGELEVPAAALEELVVNMLLHRDYFVTAPWRVMLFDDRIEIISPGSLPNNLSVANIRNGVSVTRNPILTSFGTRELPYRGLGTGVRRAVKAIPDLGLESDRDRNLFIATIPRRPA